MPAVVVVVARSAFNPRAKQIEILRRKTGAVGGDAAPGARAATGASAGADAAAGGSAAAGAEALSPVAAQLSRWFGLPPALAAAACDAYPDHPLAALAWALGHVFDAAAHDGPAGPASPLVTAWCAPGAYWDLVAALGRPGGRGATAQGIDAAAVREATAADVEALQAIYADDCVSLAADATQEGALVLPGRPLGWRTGAAGGADDAPQYHVLALRRGGCVVDLVVFERTPVVDKAAARGSAPRGFAPLPMVLAFGGRVSGAQLLSLQAQLAHAVASRAGDAMVS